MDSNTVIFLIFIIVSTFLLFQCFEFYQNYDYISLFNERYSKYEYVASPNYTYVDKTFYDPNDGESDVNNKWFCKEFNNSWYGVSPNNGLILLDGDYKKWLTENECQKYIFGSYYLNYNNPCNISNSLPACTIFKNLK